mmetsp:Transcript_12465/g.25524  ORF Transcript_12465/g.25524 Transcript_12465/m.25524 type:complete len:480 (+) Transcript_12465:314-1753(+)
MVNHSEGVGRAASVIEVMENGNSHKRAHNLEVNEDSSLDTSNLSHQNGNKKRRRPNNNNHKVELESPVRFNESTTVEDLSAVDASVYLAWVAQQAKQLPSVHIAPKAADDCVNVGNGDKNQKSKHPSGGDPIDGSAATLQVLFSKKMDILPAPSLRHLPPCHGESISQNITDHDSSSSMREDSNKTLSRGYRCSKWVTGTVSNFSKLRCFLEQEDAKQREQNGSGFRNRKIAVPRMKDRASWHVFCLGEHEAHGNIGGFFEDYDVESDSDQDGNSDENIVGGDGEGRIKENFDSSHRCESNVGDESAEVANDGEGIASEKTYDARLVPQNGYEPTTSLLLQLDQVLTRALFHHHVHYFCEWKFPLTRQRVSWVYALLARLEKPWHRDECCAVRRVLRECCSRRWELIIPITVTSKSTEMLSNDDKQKSVGADKDKTDYKENIERLASLNTLIAICGIYFEQSAFPGGDGMKFLFSSQKE